MECYYKVYLFFSLVTVRRSYIVSAECKFSLDNPYYKTKYLFTKKVTFFLRPYMKLLL